MVDHKAGEVKVEVHVDEQVSASLSMTYVSLGQQLADVTQVSFHNILITATCI